MIFVEGNDDKKFIKSLLQDLNKSNKIVVDDNFNFDNCIEIMGSKSKLLDHENSKYQKTFMKVDAGEIKKVLFIFDCDFEEDDQNCNGMENSKKCYNNLIEKLKWNIESELHIFEKNLDYFLIETIKDKKCYENFDGLIKCLAVEEIKPNKKPIANLYRDLYPYPKFDFTDSAFDELKQKLTNLFN